MMMINTEWKIKCSSSSIKLSFKRKLIANPEEFNNNNNNNDDDDDDDDDEEEEEEEDIQYIYKTVWSNVVGWKV